MPCRQCRRAVLPIIAELMTAKAILVIDMQRDFVLPSSVCCVAGAQATVPAISRMLEYARASGWAVIHIVRRHRPGGVDAEPFRRHLFADGGQFCVEGSGGARIVSGLEPRPGDYVVAKTRFDAFFRTDLEVLLRGLGTEEVYICGTQYPNCVRSTAVGALERDYAVTVVTDCCSAATTAIAEANIADMRAMGIQCLPSGDIM